MAYNSLLEKLSVRNLGLKQYGFIDDDTEFHHTQTTSDDSCSATKPSPQTASDLLNTADEGDDLLPQIYADLETLLDDMPSSLGNLTLDFGKARVSKATHMDTTLKTYPQLGHIGLFDFGKSIWCNCCHCMYSQSSSEELGDIPKLLSNCYGGDSDVYLLEQYNDSNKEESNSFSRNNLSQTQEEEEDDCLGSKEQYSPRRLGGNKLRRNSSELDEYTLLLCNKPNLKTSDILAMCSKSLLYLMADQVGFSLITALVSSCTQRELMSIVQKVSLDGQKLIDVACTNIGSRSLQGLIKKLKRLNFVKHLTEALSSDCYLLMIDEFGRHVIQHCFDYFNCKENEPLYKGVIHSCLDISKNKLGSRSINLCIDTIKGPHRKRLLDAISDQALDLSFCHYGTCVIQHVLKLHKPKFCNKISEVLTGHYARLSQSYTGSHIVENCIALSSLGLVNLIAEIETNPSILEILARHQYGNYVILRAVIISQDTDTKFSWCLVEKLLSLLPMLKNIQYSKRLVNLLQDLSI